MNKLYLLLFPIFIHNYANAQPACDNNSTEILCGSLGDQSGNPNWIWWQTSDDGIDECKMWKTENYGIVNNPFRISTNAGRKLAEIRLSEDYLPSKGWTLVKRNFGCVVGGSGTPSFILYNIETGILRVYVYIDPSNTNDFNEYMMYLSFRGSRISGLLAFADDEVKSQDHFNGANEDNDQQYNLIFVGDQTDMQSSGGWIVGDFEIAYDPYLQDVFGSSSRYTDHLLTVRVDGLSNNDLTARINGSSCSGDAEFCNDYLFSANPDDLDTNGDDILDDIESGAKGIKQVVSGASTIADYFAGKADDDVNKLTSSFESTFGVTFLSSQTTFKTISDVANNATKVSNILKDINSITKQLPGILSGISAVSGILGLTSSSPTITLTDYSFTLEGSLTRTQTITNIDFYAPGSKNLSKPSDATPYYNCTMGLGSLKNTPILRVKTSNRSSGYDDYSGNEFERVRYKSIQMTNDLTFDYPQSGPSLVDAKAFFQVKVESSYLIGKKTGRALIEDAPCCYLTRFNLLQHEIESKSLEMSTTIQEDGKEYVILASPAVELEKFKGTSINVPNSAIVNVGIITLYDNGFITKRNYAYDDSDTEDIGNQRWDEMPPFANFEYIYAGNSIINTSNTTIKSKNLSKSTPEPNTCVDASIYGEASYKHEGNVTFARLNTTLTNVKILEQNSYTKLTTTICYDNVYFVRDRYTSDLITPTQSLRLSSLESITLGEGFHAKPGSNVIIKPSAVNRSTQLSTGSVLEIEPAYSTCYNSTASNARTSLSNSIVTLEDLSSGVIIYPNPNSGVFTIRLEEPATSCQEVKILSAFNELLYHKDILDPATGIEIDLNLPVGDNYVKFYFNEGIVTKRIWIQ